MSEPTKSEPPRPNQTPAKLVDQIGAKASRKLRANRHKTPGVWFGLGMMGLVGWSVAVPMLLGAGLGYWLDHHYPGAHPYTPGFLMAGLVLGCINAWRWIANEDAAMREDHDDE